MDKKVDCIESLMDAPVREFTEQDNFSPSDYVVANPLNSGYKITISPIRGQDNYRPLEIIILLPYN